MKYTVSADLEINGDNCEGCGFKLNVKLNVDDNLSIDICGLFREELHGKRCDDCYSQFKSQEMINSEKEKACAVIAYQKGLMSYDDYLKIVISDEKHIQYIKYLQEINTAPTTENEKPDNNDSETVIFKNAGLWENNTAPTDKNK